MTTSTSEVFDWAIECPEYAETAASLQGDIRSRIYADSNRIARGEAVAS